MLATNEAVLTELGALTIMGVCPRPLFDPFSLECWSLHQALKSGVPWPWSYYEAPAVFMQARQILMAEEAAIQRMGAEGGN